MTDRTDRDDTDSDLTLATVRLILEGAQSQPEQRMRQTIAGLSMAIDSMLADDRPPQTRAALHLIQGGLASLAAGVTAGATATARHHPAATAATAGAVAVVGAVGALYLHGPTAAPETALRAPTPAASAPRPQRRTPRMVPAPKASSRPAYRAEPPRPKAAPRAPETRTMGTHERILVLTTTPTPVITLPPVSPSPPTQHPTCVQFAVRRVTRVDVCL